MPRANVYSATLYLRKEQFTFVKIEIYIVLVHGEYQDISRTSQIKIPG
jgi:hypothetical protein